MSKAVLFSFKPEWCALIANGQKTMEIRKTRPKQAPPFKGYIYCSKAGPLLYLSDSHSFGNGKVVGEFICDRITTYKAGVQFTPNHAPFSIRQLACMDAEQLWSYSGGKRVYALNITDVKLYGKLLDIWAFGRACDQKQDCGSWEPGADGCHMDGDPCEVALMRAPQSWCYVEELLEP